MEYLERGWSIIPIRPETKRPAIKWTEYQTRQPTEEEVERWWTQWPEHDIALVTGELSGILVVDCDNETAKQAADDAEMFSAVKVQTKRGLHLYFEHPRDGKRRGPRAGVNSRGTDWPKINGLDFRGDGSYALLPPSKNYTWLSPEYIAWDDMPLWRDWIPSLSDQEFDSSFEFQELDLSDVSPLTEDDFLNEWDRTAKFVRETYPNTLKIPSDMGNGRNERVMKYVSESIKDGYFGPELRMKAMQFMREFFEQPLEAREFEATCESMEQAEKRNHPENFNHKGEFTLRPQTPEELNKTRKRKLIRMKDAEQLLETADAKTYLIEPWLPSNTIVQVFGYSGHGKSLFVQHAMSALTGGKKYYGPFEIGKPAKVLYFDFEMGMATIARRLIDLRDIHGDSQDRLNIWTPFVDDKEIDLNTRDGLVEFEGWIHYVKPDVIVIDTIRSAYPGLAENSSDEWAKINKLAVRLRNAGMSVIMIHHSNKPSENGIGREAGSTNQLTVLETQIRIAQVFRDEETAKQNAALYDGNYDTPIYPQLEAKLPDGFLLYMVMEIRYGKVREWTEMHDRVQWIGFANHSVTDEKMIVSSMSTKQRAKNLALDGKDPLEIAQILNRPLRQVREWLDLYVE